MAEAAMTDVRHIQAWGYLGDDEAEDGMGLDTQQTRGKALARKRDKDTT